MAESCWTIGVEEEFLLLDAVTGRAVFGAPDVVRLLEHEPAVTPEFMRYQIETATPVCADLGQVRAELVRLRGVLADAAGRVGCVLVAAGVLPFDAPSELAAVTDQPRYRELVDRFPTLLTDGGTCGCHVHIGVPTRELGVQVLARLRPWLPHLLAVSANSPFALGQDTGWASRRHPMWSQWPTARPPEIWADTMAYDRAMRDAVDSGDAVDERGVYWHARLSPRYPTVEVRISDVCLSVDDAVLLAGLVRALVATAVEEFREGRPAPAVRTATITAALSAAALAVPASTSSPARSWPSGSCARVCSTTCDPAWPSPVTRTKSTGSPPVFCSAVPGRTGSGSCVPLRRRQPSLSPPWPTRPRRVGRRCSRSRATAAETGPVVGLCRRWRA